MFDYIIVGAGSAGCVMAERLSADGRRRVLVLEAGGWDANVYMHVPVGVKQLGTKYDWRFEAEPDATRGGKVDTWAAGRVVGGGSTVNAMLWVRGSRADYDGWADDGCVGWDYDSIERYFRRTETYDGPPSPLRGSAGPQHIGPTRVNHHLTDAFIAAAVATGHRYNPDYNSGDQLGVARGQQSQRRGWRHSTARAYLHRAALRRNVTVKTGVVVHRVVIEDGRAVGVEYRKGDRLYRERCAREVVLSAGAIASPKLLMLSGIGPATQLQSQGLDVVADSPMVGENLQEHAYLAMSIGVNVTTLNQEVTPLGVVKHGLDFALRGRGPATSAFGHALVFSSFEPDSERSDSEMIFAPFGLGNARSESAKRTVAQAEHDAAASSVYHHDVHEMTLAKTSTVTCLPSILHPRARGSVILRSADPDAPPVIRHELFSDPADIRALTKAARGARDIFAAEPFRSFIVSEEMPGPSVQTDEQWATAIKTYGFRGEHPVGTCRMGDSPDTVLDPHLRVRGVGGLRVVDASVMPTIVSGNTNAATIMIAERAADLILDAVNEDTGAVRAAPGF